MKRILVILFLFTSVALAQTSERPRQRMGAGQGVAGTISEMKTDSFTLKTLAGKTVTVKLTPETRFRKDRQPAKLSDFKAGDMVMVGGEPAGDDAWTARLVASRSGGMMFSREGMGKEFIAGQVKAIEGTKLTIARVDGQEQSIEVDENTSFRKGGESITLPDIKVDDHVFGRGQLNSSGVFVPSVLNVGEPGMMRRGPGGPGANRQPPK